MKILVFSVSIVFQLFVSTANAQLSKKLFAADLHDGMLKIPTEHQEMYPIAPDWSLFLPEKYASLKRGAIPEELVDEFEKRRDKYSYAEFFFKAPLTKIFKDKYYYLVSERGIDQIEMDSVGVTVKYVLEEKSSVVKYVNYLGYLIAPPEWTNYPGFVLISDKEEVLNVNKLAFDVKDVGEDDPVHPKLTDNPDVDVSTAFSVGDKKNDSVFGFIAFKKSDKQQCAFRAVLVGYDEGRPMIAQWNYTDCRY